MAKTLSFTDTSPQTVKIGDTTTSFTLVCGNDNVATDLTKVTSITVKLGNSSGYLKSATIDLASLTDPTTGQVTVKFSPDLMNSLPAGNYYIEVWVVDSNGTSIYPSDGTVGFTINNNIQSANGSTITTITFDDFVEAMNKAASTIAKGDKGEKGDTGTVDNDGLTAAPAFVELKAQVDNQENDLNNNINNKLSQISAVPETFAKLSDLQVAYPNGKTGLFVTADTGHKYIWANNVWTDAGVYQSVGIAEKSLTAPMTNFLIKASILTDDIPVKIDKSLKSNIGITFYGAMIDNPDNIVWYKVPVTGGRSYSAYYHEMPKLPTQLVIMEFQNGVSVKRYSVPGDNPTFVVDPATEYVHISLASNKADYTAVKIILSEASSRIGKNAVETDNGWEARLTKSESEIDNLTDKYLNRIKSGNSFVKSIGGFLPLSIDNVFPDVSGSVNFSNKQRFADNSVMINSIYSSKSGRFKIDLGGTKSFEDLTLVFFAPIKTSPDVTVKCSVSQDGVYSDTLPATSINGKYSTGWNYVKLTPSLFRGLPTTADAIYLTITSRDSKTDGEIYGTLYLDSIIFDLKQTPVVCLSFDQLHQESFDNGAYQYLLNSGLPFSLYCRGWDDTSLVSAEWLDWAKNAEYKYGAELGVYGSYGDAQWAVNGATDYDSAKVNLAASWSAFFKTFGHAPATYASAQAFTSEFSLRAAKDVGFKIVRGGQLNMLNAYLDKNTMQLPMTSLSYNTNADNIKNKIDTAIQYGYQLNLFTHGAYDTASDSDYLKLADFKSMIDYLAEQRTLGKLKVLTIDDYVTQAIKGVF